MFDKLNIDQLERLRKYAGDSLSSSAQKQLEAAYSSKIQGEGNENLHPPISPQSEYQPDEYDEVCAMIVEGLSYVDSCDFNDGKYILTFADHESVQPLLVSGCTCCEYDISTGKVSGCFSIESVPGRDDLVSSEAIDRIIMQLRTVQSNFNQIQKDLSLLFNPTDGDAGAN